MKKILFLCLLLSYACSTNDHDLTKPLPEPLGMSPGTDFVPRLPANGIDCSVINQWDAIATSVVNTPDQYGTWNTEYTLQPQIAGFYAGVPPKHQTPGALIVLTFRVTNYGQTTYKYQINYGPSITVSPGMVSTFVRVYNSNACNPMSVPSFTLYFRRQNCGGQDPLGGGYYHAPVFSLLSVSDSDGNHSVAPQYYGHTPVTLHGYQAHSLTCP